MIVQVKCDVQSTRTRLLESARYLFWEKGFAATGMAELLDRAQANSGSFYHFFDSKEALLLALLDSYQEGLEPVIVQPAEAKYTDPLDRIFGILQGYRERLITTECRYGCPIGRLALEIEAENLPATQPDSGKLLSLGLGGSAIPGGCTGTVPFRHRS